MTTIANHQQAHAAPPQAGPLQQFAADGRPIHEAVADVLARGLPLNREMPADFDGRWRRAELYAASGLMPKGMDTPEKVFVALDLGAALGLAPMMSVQNIAVINGKPSVMFQVKLAVAAGTGLLERHGVEVSGPDDALSATYTVKRRGRDPVVKTWTLADAKRADLLGKDNWKKYPRDMLTARAGDRAIKEAFPELFAGLMSPDEAEEIDAPPARKELGRAAPAPWSMTTKLFVALKRKIAAKKIPKEEIERLGKEATVGRVVPKDGDDVPLFTEEEYGRLEALVAAWGSAAPTQAKPAAPAAPTVDREPGADDDPMPRAGPSAPTAKRLCELVVKLRGKGADVGSEVDAVLGGVGVRVLDDLDEKQARVAIERFEAELLEQHRNGQK